MLLPRIFNGTRRPSQTLTTAKCIGPVTKWVGGNSRVDPLGFAQKLWRDTHPLQQSIAEKSDAL